MATTVSPGATDAWDMNANQTNKLNMYQTVGAVLTSHETVWQSLPAFATAAEEFDETVLQIQRLAQTQASRTGAAADKAQALHALGDVAYEIAAATRACAVAASNRDLAGRVDFSRSNVTKGRDTEVVARCQDIHAAATAYWESLGDYGVTAAKLTLLKKKIEAFQAVQPKPRQGLATSSAATKQLTKFFSEADEVLNERLDGLAVQFKTAQPAFFNEYTTARGIVDNPGGRSTRDVNVVSVPGVSSNAKAA